MVTTDIDLEQLVPPFRQAVPSRLAILGLTLMPTMVAAAGFEAAAELGVTYTDNIGLTTTNEVSETVYRVIPSFGYSKESPRISASVHYRLDGFYYADLSESEVFHQFDGDVEAALIPEKLFLNFGATRYQSIRDPDARVPQGNLPISTNRVNRDDFYVGPRFQLALGRSITLQGDYRLSWVEYDEVDIDNTDQQGIAKFSIDNYRRGTGLTWAARYNWRRTEYDNLDPFEYQQASGELGFWAGKNLRVFAGGGEESAWDMPLDPGLDDSFWEAGFSQQVSTSLSAEFAAGERSFGSSWRGNLEYEFKRGKTSLQYAETATTEGRNAFNPGSFRVPDSPNNNLARPGSGQRYVFKRFQWNLNLNLQRSKISLTVFDGRQTDRTEADGAPLTDQEQRGVSVSVTRWLGARTELSLRGSWSERETAVDDTSDLVRATVAVSYKLGPRTNLSLTYGYAEEDDDRLDASTRDYTANTVSLFLSRSF